MIELLDCCGSKGTDKEPERCEKAAMKKQRHAGAFVLSKRNIK